MDLFSIGLFIYILFKRFYYHNVRKKYRKDMFLLNLSFFHTCIACFALFTPLLTEFKRPLCYGFDPYGDQSLTPILPLFGCFVKGKIIRVR